MRQYLELRKPSPKERTIAKVTLKNLTKRFGDMVVLDGLEMLIDDSEFVAILGPSGCGKTTILRMIAGLEEITCGSVKIGDRLVNDLAPEDRGIAMITRNHVLYPYMDIGSNISFGLRQLKITGSEIRRRINESASIFGIHDILDRKPGQLSVEQKKLVAFSKAVAREPEVFLMDDPLCGLHKESKIKMMKTIKKIHQTLEATIIYVTNDREEAKSLADRVLSLGDGNP